MCARALGAVYRAGCAAAALAFALGGVTRLEGVEEAPLLGASPVEVLSGTLRFAGFAIRSG